MVPALHALHLTPPAAQYQVNGSTDAYDPIRPTTTACPYLPGQVVNTLYIPVERSLRQRSASLSSLDQDCFRTMDPQSKFQTPKPVLPLAAAADDDDDTRYIGTAAPACAPFVVREPTPKSSWRRFFARKMASRDLANGQDDDAPRPVTQGERSIATAPSNYDGGRSTAVSDGPRSRDMSPNSLRRFLLSEDLSPTSTAFTFDDLPQLLPYDIADQALEEADEEDDDDDDNFAAPAAAFEQTIYTTRLSPPPFKRTTSSDSQPATGLNSSALTLIPQRQPTAIKPTTALPDSSATIPKLKTTSLTLTPSEPSSATTSSPVSPQSLSAEFPSSFYDDSDALSANEEEDGATQDLSSPVSVFRGYSLPRVDDEDGYYGKQANYHVSGAAAASPRFATVNSPQLLPRGGGGVAAAAAAATGQAGNGVDFLGGSLDVGLDDFAAEMGWLADSITRHA